MNPSDVQAIIDKYGMPAWMAAQRQVWVDFTMDLIWIALLLGLAAILWRQRARGRRWTDTLDSFDSGLATAGVLAATRFLPVLLVILTVAAPLEGAITIIVNPTWAAIQILASLLPGK